MRDGRLGQVDTFFDIAGAKTRILADRAGASDFQDLQDAAAGRVGDRMQQTAEGLILGSHLVEIDRKSMAVNVGDFRLTISDFRFSICNLQV